MQFRCSGLAVPAPELLQINSVCSFHCADKIVTSHGLSIVSIEIKISAFAKIFPAQQSIDHTHDFRTFFINRHGVEVIDFHVGIRTNRMTHRSGIFRKLMHTQSVCVCDTLHCSGIQVRGKFLIAENGETFLEAQLKPVTAGHTIS